MPIMYLFFIFFSLVDLNHTPNYVNLPMNLIKVSQHVRLIMPVKNNNALLNQLPYLRLRFSHAAIGTYPCFNSAAKPVNIFFTVLSKGQDDDSYIRDIQSGSTLPIEPDTCYFIPINRMAQWKLSSEVHFISLHFNLECFYGVDLFQNYPECLSWKASEISNELRDIFQTTQPLAPLFQINAIVYRVCDLLLKRHNIDAPSYIMRLQHYGKVIKHVRNNGNAATRVEELADLMEMRPNVFSRNFSRDLGISPKTFLVNTLLRKAMDCLRTPGASVRATAKLLHFSSEYYFSTFFKKNAGMSPKTYQLNNMVEGW